MNSTVSYLHVFVEEPSAEAALTHLLPKLLPASIGWNILSFQGRDDLLTKLPSQFVSYAQWIPDDHRIVVLVDEDRQDCSALKERLEESAHLAGLPTVTSAGNQGRVLNRIAVEELEAWFFGDPDALRKEFDRLPDFERREAYRHPDQVQGGTWEALERLLRRYGYYQAGLAKIDLAERVSRHMVPKRNRSPSFRCFSEGLLELCR